VTSNIEQPGTARLDRLLAYCWFAALAVAVFLASHWTLPMAVWAEFDNIYFQADIALVYANMTALDSNHYRTGMHPLFSIVMWPLVELGRTLTDAPQALIVRLLLALNAGAAAAMVFLILRRITEHRTDALLYTALFCVSASSVFWLTVPETFAFGGTTILLMLVISATTVDPRVPTLVLANIATMSMTLTNWMVGIYATLRMLWPRWKVSVGILVSAGCAVILLGIASKLVIPSSGYAGDFRRYVSWIRPPHASDFRSFFVHSVVMPAPIYRARGDGALEIVNEESTAGGGSATGVAGTLLWLALLALGTAGALALKRGSRAFRDILLLSVASQLLLHVMFADGPFLYAAHFAPMLVVLSAYASSFRGTRVLVAAAIVAISFNNLTVFNEMTHRMARDLQPWLESHGKPMAGATARLTGKPATAAPGAGR